MIILKYIFLLLILLGSCLLGILVSRKYKNRVQELREFNEAINILENKMQFTYQPLGEIFEEITEITTNENGISKIFKQTKENMKNSNVNSSWNEAIEDTKQFLSLNKEDITIIKGLGKLLGKTDVQGQISEINLTKSFIDIQIKKAEEECKKNEKLYRTLGTIVGLALVIILI